MKLCSIEVCENNHLAKGFCNKHYQRNKKYGNPTYVVVRICSVTGCNKKHKGLGYCVNHLIHYRNHGDPLVYADPEETKKKQSHLLKEKLHGIKEKQVFFLKKHVEDGLKKEKEGHHR